MNKDMNCNIVKDLIPSYIDGLCSQDSKILVEEHIKTCPACKAVFDSMADGMNVEASDDQNVGGVNSSDVISIDEKAVMQKVNQKLKKDAQRKVTKYVIAAIVTVVLVIMLVLPIQSMNVRDLNIRYTTFSVSENVGENGVYFSQLGESDTVYTSKNADLDSDMLYPIETYWDQGCIYADQQWIDEHPVFSIVNVWSKKPISKYNYSVHEENGRNVFGLDYAKTYVLAPESADGYVMQIVVETNVDEVK